MTDQETITPPDQRIKHSAFLYSAYIWTIFTLNHPESYWRAVYGSVDHRRPPAKVLHTPPPYAENEAVLQQELISQLRKLTNFALGELSLPPFIETTKQQRDQLVVYLGHVVARGLEKASDLIEQDRSLTARLCQLDRELVEDLYRETPTIPLEQLLGQHGLED